MLKQGHALAEENGPSFGRAMGGGSDFETATTNLPIQQHNMKQDKMQQHKMKMDMELAQQRMAPGYPQDMFMPMDEMVAKPETYGLRPTWSASVQGMMTLVRVLPPDLYDKVRALQAEAKR